MLDGGHVLGAMAGPEPGEVVVEDDVQHPVEAVLDAPVCADRPGEGDGVELGGGQVVAAGGGGVAVAFDDGLDHADGGEARKARLAGMTAVGGEPGDVVGHGMASYLDPAVIAVGGLKPVEHGCRRVGEITFDLAMQARPVGLGRQQVVRILGQDCPGNPRLAADGVDGHEGAGQRQPLEQQRDGDDLVRLAGHCLLAQHQALAGRPRRDQVQRAATLGARMCPSRGLAVDGDNVRLTLPKLVDPADEARLEQCRIEGVDQIVQRVVRGDAALERREATEKVQVLPAPVLDLDEVVGAGKRGTQHQQQDLRQRIDHLPGLTRVLQGAEIVQQGCL